MRYQERECWILTFKCRVNVNNSCLTDTGPDSFTTDRCCHEKKFLEKTLSLDPIDEDNESEESEVDDGTFATELYDVVALPSPSKVAYTSEIAQLHVGKISNYFLQNQDTMKVVALDTEYHRW